jgi:hypothetical protein
MLSRPRLFDRILVLADIAAGRSKNWIATDHSHGRAFVRSIRRALNDPMEKCMNDKFQNDRPVGSTF